LTEFCNALRKHHKRRKQHQRPKRIP
jgi:hypothetical protein